MYYDACRVYIDCEVRWKRSGMIIPAAVYWPDHTGTVIRREVTAYEGCTDTEILSECGFTGILHIVHIGGKRRRLYFEKRTGRWFAEIRKRA